METFMKIDGYTVEIRPGDWAENPREWTSLTGTALKRRPQRRLDPVIIHKHPAQAGFSQSGCAPLG